MAEDRYFLKIGNGPRWEVTKEEYDEGHKLVRLVQDVEFELKAAQATIRTAAEQLDMANAEVAELREEVEALRRDCDSWQAKCHKAWDKGDGDALKIVSQARELERLRTIIGELGAAEAAEPDSSP